MAQVASGLRIEEMADQAVPRGRLAFTGWDLAIDGGGYIEGAISSGRAAAQQVLASRG